jgi:hypothetical protein
VIIKFKIAPGEAVPLDADQPGCKKLPCKHHLASRDELLFPVIAASGR